jgi:octaprenyl-diphosphate synthase
MIVEDGDQDMLWIFADCIRSMAEGELLQLERSFDATVTESHYFAVIERKSAVLLSVATEVGAILGGVTRGERRRLRDFGREVGLAFQLRDDALDYEQTDDTLGKRRYTDLREGKVTLPLLLALKRCTPAEREAIGAVLKTAASQADTVESRDALDFAPVLGVVDRYRGVADTVRRAEQHMTRAAAAIAPFSEGRAKEDVLAAARFAVGRDR